TQALIGCATFINQSGGDIPATHAPHTQRINGCGNRKCSTRVQCTSRRKTNFFGRSLRPRLLSFAVIEWRRGSARFLLPARQYAQPVHVRRWSKDPAPERYRAVSYAGEVPPDQRPCFALALCLASLRLEKHPRKPGKQDESHRCRKSR